MKTYFRYLSFILLLVVSLPTWARQSAPEATVLMVYISTLRCEAQHPKLKKRMQSAYNGWVKRNKKYVDSARKMVDFAGIANQYKAGKAKDKRFSYKTCASYIKRLQNPANDIKNK
jgi:hypothetical protein